jgi:NAD+ synthase (glutamine-hydrolysing)
MAEPIPRVRVHSALCGSGARAPTAPLGLPRYYCPEEEIARGPACWMWDYLRRCGRRARVCLGGRRGMSWGRVSEGGPCGRALKGAGSGSLP